MLHQPTVSDALLPLTSLFPSKSRRWIADNCRAGRIAGAVKIGREWFLSRANYERLQSGASPDVRTVPDAADDLRRRGVLA